MGALGALRGSVFVVHGAVVALAIRSYMTISIATDTTVLTTPLLPMAIPITSATSTPRTPRGVQPEENAWIAILRCCGHDEIDKAVRVEHYRKLGIEPLPEGVLYFQAFYDTEGLKLVPESVLIASSVARSCRGTRDSCAWRRSMRIARPMEGISSIH